MALYGGPTLQGDLVRGTIAEIKGLTVDKLKQALRQESLLVSGIKHELQIRLIAHVENLARNNDQDRLRRLRDTIRGTQSPYNAQRSYPSPYSNSPSTTTTTTSSNYYSSNNSSNNNNNSPPQRLPSISTISTMPPSLSYLQRNLNFKPSPFYEIKRSLTSVRELHSREHTRDVARVYVELGAELAADMASDNTLRVMMFCTAESFDSYARPTDIAFPQHAEIKVNSEEIKVNLKGLKNKPGSTRPADITDHLRKRGNYRNSIELVYALTSKDVKKYFMVIYLVSQKPIESLVTDLKLRRPPLSKDRVIREMRTRAADDDIVATSSKMSLKDPVQMTRIGTPCRGLGCKHNECFDAAVFLALQEQAPTWNCPICNKSTPWDQLIFDKFFEDILENTSPDTEQVTVEPDGRWHVGGDKPTHSAGQGGSSTPVQQRHNESRQNKNHDNDDSEDDDDLIEIQPGQARDSLPYRQSSETPRTLENTRKTPTPATNGFMHPPPPPASASATPSVPPSDTSRGQKRPRSQVIDLTLSDDDEDDEPPVSRIKRPSFSSQPSDSNYRLFNGDTADRDSASGLTRAGSNQDFSPRFSSFTLPPLSNITQRSSTSTHDYRDSGGGGGVTDDDNNLPNGYRPADSYRPVDSYRPADSSRYDHSYRY